MRSIQPASVTLPFSRQVPSGWWHRSRGYIHRWRERIPSIRQAREELKEALKTPLVAWHLNITRLTPDTQTTLMPEVQSTAHIFTLLSFHYTHTYISQMLSFATTRPPLCFSLLIPPPTPSRRPLTWPSLCTRVYILFCCLYSVLGTGYYYCFFKCNKIFVQSNWFLCLMILILKCLGGRRSEVIPRMICRNTSKDYL